MCSTSRRDLFALKRVSQHDRFSLVTPGTGTIGVATQRRPRLRLAARSLGHGRSRPQPTRSDEWIDDRAVV
jgi:hypothetical protein